MRIVLFGDSITDMGRNRERNKSTDIYIVTGQVILCLLQAICTVKTLASMR